MADLIFRIRASADALEAQGVNSLENCSTIKKARKHFCKRALWLLKNPAIPTFALVGTIIGSESLTTVFGMGTGGPFGYGHRERNTEAVAVCVPIDLRKLRSFDLRCL